MLCAAWKIRWLYTWHNSSVVLVETFWYRKSNLRVRTTFSWLETNRCMSPYCYCYCYMVPITATFFSKSGTLIFAFSCITIIDGRYTPTVHPIQPSPSNLLNPTQHIRSPSHNQHNTPAPSNNSLTPIRKPSTQTHIRHMNLVCSHYAFALPSLSLRLVGDQLTGDERVCTEIREIGRS